MHTVDLCISQNAKMPKYAGKSERQTGSVSCQNTVYIYSSDFAECRQKINQMSNAGLVSGIYPPLCQKREKKIRQRMGGAQQSYTLQGQKKIKKVDANNYQRR